ncbi:DUF4238 domain-containing protein [Leisingera sp. SS27]|uniref:DUF4238 domain-containing protein n=1 Tax=Leisingera sp. SS27 TaxID=2979462 RepID=UPI002330CECB|nr:DUF4238 domain-containing protein [Leisingera sp. SS27]MDC0658283.1 DUF4238 domain-containing protein [Leisingera sp. SS27]
MALDHYVSQVHLREFADPKTKKLFAVSKLDLRDFTPKPKSVCAIRDGNTNEFLKEPRLIEKLLEAIEPNYPYALNELRNRRCNNIVRETIAGFITAVSISSPTFDRLCFDGTHNHLADFAKHLDTKSILPKFPENSDKRYSGKSITELLDQNLVEFNIDMNMPKAMATTRMINVVKAFLNAPWDILENHTERNFLTSDYPMVHVPTLSRRWSKKFVPLAPDIGIVVYSPRVSIWDGPVEVAHVEVSSSSKISELNRFAVFAAEDLVFADRPSPFLRKFVAKHRQMQLVNDSKRNELRYVKRKS